MSHNLTINKLSGTHEMFYVQETPWHGLGHRVDQALTSEEALKTAELGWSVKKFPLQVVLPDPKVNGAKQFEDVTDKQAIYRTDTMEYLGVVGSGFHPIQNCDAFKILDDLVGSQEAMFHTAGSLGGGVRVWALVKLPEQLVVVGDDVVDQYLLLANGHDGSLALTMRFTPIRVVCENTLMASMGAGYVNGKFRQKKVPDGMYVRHTANADVRVEEARRVLGIAVKYFEVAGERYRAMSARQVTSTMLDQYFKRVFPLSVPEHPTMDQVSAAVKKQKELHETLAFLFQEGRGNQLKGVSGTAWAAFNAVTEWVDHVYPVTKGGQLKKNGLETALFGTGQDIRNRAMAEAEVLLATA